MNNSKFKPIWMSLCCMFPICGNADWAETGSVDSVINEPTTAMVQPKVLGTEGSGIQLPEEVSSPAVSSQRDHGWFVTADLICWKAQIGGLEYAMTGVADGDGNVPLLESTKQGKVFTADFDAQPGFKLGLGYQFQHDGWDLFAQYTWLNGSKNRNHVDTKPMLGAATIVTTPTPVGTVITVPISSGSSTWEQSFNVVDVELGKGFLISPQLSVRPFIGLKGAWITEQLDYHFTTTETLTGILAGNIFKIHQHKNQKMWGIGTRAGVNSLWHFSKSWGIYGDLAFTSLWCDIHTHPKDRYTFVDAGMQFTDLDTTNTITEVNMILETSLGFTYLAWFKQGRYQLTLKAGWEEQVWFNLNHFNDVTRTGNLTLQGLTMRVGFAF